MRFPPHGVYHLLQPISPWSLSRPPEIRNGKVGCIVSKVLKLMFSLSLVRFGNTLVLVKLLVVHFSKFSWHNDLHPSRSECLCNENTASLGWFHWQSQLPWCYLSSWGKLYCAVHRLCCAQYHRLCTCS